MTSFPETIDGVILYDLRRREPGTSSVVDLEPSQRSRRRCRACPCLPEPGARRAGLRGARRAPLPGPVPAYLGGCPAAHRVARTTGARDAGFASPRPDGLVAASDRPGRAAGSTRSTRPIGRIRRRCGRATSPAKSRCRARAPRARPCGDGVGRASELDAAAGYGAVDSSAAVRLRVRDRERRGYDTAIDDRSRCTSTPSSADRARGRPRRARLGPASHTQVGWGDNAPPLDGVRAGDLAAGRIAENLRGSVVYVLGRLRDPQTYPGNLVSITRGQLDIADRVELGMMQLLQLEGDGAPHLGFVDFVKEHVTRGDASAGPTDSRTAASGFDVAWRIDGFGGARLVLRADVRGLAPPVRGRAPLRRRSRRRASNSRDGIVVEWQKTGFRSMEHDTAHAPGSRTPTAPSAARSGPMRRRCTSATDRARTGQLDAVARGRAVRRAIPTRTASISRSCGSPRAWPSSVAGRRARATPGDSRELRLETEVMFESRERRLARDPRENVG